MKEAQIYPSATQIVFNLFCSHCLMIKVLFKPLNIVLHFHHHLQFVVKYAAISTHIVHITRAFRCLHYNDL
jgi:hypothetical protein